MAAVEDKFRYSVELDTQGLASQLASVRDVVGQGLSGAVRGVTGGAAVAGGAMNQISSDIMTGQQMIAAAVPAQMMPPVGIAHTTLANVPGMPQTLGQEVTALLGLNRAPVGVFPQQFQAVAQQRLQERFQQAAVGAGAATASGAASFLAWGPAAAMGARLFPGAPSLLGMNLAGLGLGLAGAFGASMLAEAAIAPLIENVQERMMGRSQIQQVFGWNQFNSDQRAVMGNEMRQVFAKSLFSPDEFNQVLPAATMGGFFRGVKRGDTMGFANSFRAAENFFTEAQFSLGLSGPEGIRMAGELSRGFRRAGVGDPRAVSRMFNQARALGQQMLEMGEFVDPTEITQQTLQMGQAALQFGLSPQRAMDMFSGQLAMTNRMIANRELSEDDVALLGGSPMEAAQRMTMSLMGTQRQPIFKAMALAFGQTDAMNRGASVNQAALESIGAGRMSFSALTERLSQMTGSGVGGTTRLMTLMANQQKLQGDMMATHGQSLRGLTDDLLKTANMEVTDGTRMFMMQNVFGVGEAESRALVRGLPSEAADRKELERSTLRVDREVKDAVSTMKDSTVQKFDELLRGLKETLGKPLDDISRSIAESVAPPLQSRIPDYLESIDRKMDAFPMRSNSPISVGPVRFSDSHTPWMTAPDPMTLAGFRSVMESRKYPMAILPMAQPPMTSGDLMRLSGPETVTRPTFVGT